MSETSTGPRPDLSPDLTIVSRRVYRGPNVWHYEPAIQLVVDLGVLEDFPTNLIPANQAACETKEAVSVPATMLDLYVCEASNTATVKEVNIWCGKGSGHWRKVGSTSANGSWNATTKQCFAGAGVYYPNPKAEGKVAVSFNVVVKAGIGHGVAPADIYVLRY